jgi:hypothetical protein
MSNNNHKRAACAFAEQIVPYLYDECEKEEQTKFEVHLNECSICSDEYAGFGFVRSSVLEWRDKDFSHLATPTFDFSEIAGGKISPFVSTQSGSWFGEIKKLFSFNPAFAMAALAMLIVCTGITFFALTFSGDKEIADTGNQTTEVKTVVSPTTDVSKKADDKSTTGKETEKSDPLAFETVNNPVLKKHNKTIMPVKSAVKVSTGYTKSNTDKSNPNLKKTNDSIKNSLPVKKNHVPNLNDFDLDEDETIRLADLFDELDTKKFLGK